MNRARTATHGSIIFLCKPSSFCNCCVCHSLFQTFLEIHLFSETTKNILGRKSNRIQEVKMQSAEFLDAITSTISDREKRCEVLKAEV